MTPRKTSGVNNGSSRGVGASDEAAAMTPRKTEQKNY